jgi:hypothetical protein
VIRVIDDVLADPMAYREKTLSLDFSDVTIGDHTFKGIADAKPILEDRITLLTFFRKSPQGQLEPNYIHSDAWMGRETGIFYMNPDPPEGDGTTFWKSPEGRVSGPWTETVAQSARSRKGWTAWKRCPAKFNRLVVFDSDLFHSRSILENYGLGDEARLIQVMFLQ